MAQFDVYPNPHPASRDFAPYLLDVQSPLIDKLPTRLVMPLSRVTTPTNKLPANLCPLVQIGSETLAVQAHLLAPLAARLLKKPVLSLRHRASDFAATVDAVISGF